MICPLNSTVIKAELCNLLRHGGFCTLQIILEIPLVMYYSWHFDIKSKNKQTYNEKVSINSVILLNKLVCSRYSCAQSYTEYIDNACCMYGLQTSVAKTPTSWSTVHKKLLSSNITKLDNKGFRSRNHDKADKQNNWVHSSPLLSAGNKFQHTQWMLETTNSIEPYMCYVFSYTCIPLIKFNL